MIKVSLITLLLLTSLTFAQNAEMAMAILKGEIITSRREILTQNMELTPEQAPIFWKIYDEFAFQQKPLLDESATIANEYSELYQNITEKKADELAQRHFKNIEKNVKLRKKYYKKIARKISIPVALRFTQIINRLDLDLRLKVTEILPIIEVDNVTEEKKSFP